MPPTEIPSPEGEGISETAWLEFFRQFLREGVRDGLQFLFAGRDLVVILVVQVQHPEGILARVDGDGDVGDVRRPNGPACPADNRRLG